MACLRRSSLHVPVALPAAALAALLVFVMTACQPIQAPETTGSEQSAGATETTTVTSSVAETEVVSDVKAQPDTASPTETMTATVTVSVTNSDTNTMTVAVEETPDGDNSVGGDTSAGDASDGQDADLIATGLVVYRAQYCGVCHTVDAAETRGTFGPPHNGMGATAVARLADPNYHGSATTPHEYIVESLVDPLAYIVPGYAQTSHRMPIYTHLTAEELDALAAFLLAQ